MTVDLNIIIAAITIFAHFLVLGRFVYTVSAKFANMKRDNFEIQEKVKNLEEKIKYENQKKIIQNIVVEILHSDDLKNQLKIVFLNVALDKEFMTQIKKVFLSSTEN